MDTDEIANELGEDLEPGDTVVTETRQRVERTPTPGEPIVIPIIGSAIDKRSKFSGVERCTVSRVSGPGARGMVKHDLHWKVQWRDIIALGVGEYQLQWFDRDGMRLDLRKATGHSGVIQITPELHLEWLEGEGASTGGATADPAATSGAMSLQAIMALAQRYSNAGDQRSKEAHEQQTNWMQHMQTEADRRSERERDEADRRYDREQREHERRMERERETALAAKQADRDYFSHMLTVVQAANANSGNQIETFTTALQLGADMAGDSDPVVTAMGEGSKMVAELVSLAHLRKGTPRANTPAIAANAGKTKPASDKAAPAKEGDDTTKVSRNDVYELRKLKEACTQRGVPLDDLLRQASQNVLDATDEELDNHRAEEGDDDDGETPTNGKPHPVENVRSQDVSSPT